MSNELIWVNENNEVTGYGEKISTHRANQLHRAFSVFIYDKERGEFLLQKRAPGKYHSGGKWSNSCCSHPYRGESWGAAILRCIRDELCADFTGSSWSVTYSLISTDREPCVPSSCFLQYAGRFCYNSHYGELSEHEMDHVFVLFVSSGMRSLFQANPDEIAELSWVPAASLGQYAAGNPESFSSWFGPAFSLARKII